DGVCRGGGVRWRWGRRVVESGVVDLIDPGGRNIFDVRRKSSPENFSSGGDDVGGGVRRLAGGGEKRKCILSGPYKPTTVLVQVIDATDDSPAVPEHTTVETPMNMSPKNKAHFLAEKEAIHLILTGIRDDTYSTVDACQTAQEMWEAIERTNGEALRKCILSGPYKPTTILVQAVDAIDDSPAVPEHTTVETPMNMSPKNKAHFLAEKEAIHLILTGIGDDIYSTVDACQTEQEMWEAIERLQQEWSKFVTIVKQQHKLDEVSYHKLFDILKQYQNEVNELCAERLERNVNTLALVTTAHADQDQYYQTSRSHKSHAPSSKPSILTRSHTSTRHKGKEIAKPITPPSEIASEEDSDPEQAQRDNDMQKNLALIAKYFKKIYKPTNNNLRTSSNSKNKNVDTTPRDNVGSKKPKRMKDFAYHKEKMLLCKQAEHGVLLQAEQYDWLADTDEEVDEQELEAHYSYMAKIQEVPTADSGTDSEPNEQNDVESDDERVALANLKLDVDENKKIQKQLMKANTTLAQELKECKTILAETSKSLGESISVRDSCLTKQAEFEKYQAFNDRTIDYDKLEQIVDNAWIKHSKDQFRAPTAQDMEILIQTCSMPLAIKTQNDSLNFFHELKQEMHADLKYVESLEKEIDKLESDKAEFSDMYDVILQECVSNDVKCSYLQSLSDLDALNELQYKNIAISELKKLIEKGKGKSVDTKFDRPSVVRQPNAQRIPKPSVLEGLSKPVTAQTLPQEAKKATVRNTNPRVSTSIGVNHKPNVSRPQHKSNQSRDKVLPNNSQVKVKKTQVEVHPRTKKPTVVPISTRKPKSQANKLVATHHKKQITSNSTNQKPQSYFRVLYENTSKAWKWWIERQSPSGYKWIPKLKKQWVPKAKIQWVPKAKNDHVQKRIVLLIRFIVESGCTKHMTGNLKLLCNFVEKFMRTVRFGNDQFAPILGYGDLGSQHVLLEISRVMIYSLAWLWHRRLSHLNFDYINLLSKKDIVIGLPKLKDGKNLDKMKEKGDQCILVGYSTQSKGYHVYNKRTRMIVESIHIRFDEIKEVFETSVANNTSGLVSQQQKATYYDNPDPVPQRQDVSSSADAHVPSQQELDLLFNPLYDEFSNAGSNIQDKQPSTNIPSTSAPSTHTNVHAEENNNDQAEEGE
nr:hypothetical protein [Tanacetum cinerariifolium]